ncbi:MAG: hypothetical protein G3M78_06235 [Candidatus Nitrohelix vancouverensis]|uniref:Tetratricopeptide repeat protein n=1 Tax=Candidatus Nitrohelix vancouverensis TaxID=2705534 RepID=A0A7T0C1V9_9BACT|nr:MAG: hypothetical protein G3M78_06235 [Candidatus Nitrohelix vancouverensis]
MDFHIAYLAITAIIAASSRLPFRNFPIDDDFAVHTYIARFKRRGFEWKKDLQLIGIPIWKMKLLDRFYKDPSVGVDRIRHLQTALHILGAWGVYALAWMLTGDATAALIGGALYAFYGTSPDLSAGSFNHEQFYIPLVLFGTALCLVGPQWAFVAGLCFGFATFAKTTAGLHGAALAPVALYSFGINGGLVFVSGMILPALISQIAERRAGYMDSLSRRQLAARYATTIRSTKTKSMYFSLRAEILQLASRSLPLWLVGLPGLVFAFNISGDGLWMAGLTLGALGMIIGQRAFSRYHFLPPLSLFSVGAAVAWNAAWETNETLGGLIAVALTASTLWSLSRLWFFYARPNDAETIARYEKFDQYLYIPYLAKILRRWYRIHKLDEERIYIWGTFVQLYPLTGRPSSDTYLHYCIGPWNTPSLEIYYDNLIGGLIRHKPPLLIRAFHDLDLHELERLTGLQYKQVKISLCRFPVYRLNAFRSVSQNPLNLSWQEKMQWMDRLTSAGKHIPGIARSPFTPNEARSAYKECKKLLRLNPDDLEGQLYFGELCHYFQKHDEAVEAYDKVLQREPNRWYLRTQIAASEIQNNRLERAETLLHEEHALYQDKWTASDRMEWNFQSGLLALKRGDDNAALGYLVTALPQTSERMVAWEGIIAIHQRANNTEALNQLLETTKSIVNVRDREWVIAHIASSLASIEADADSVTLSRILERYPENCLLRYALASALERERRIAESQVIFQELSRSEKCYVNIQAASLFRLGRLAEGEQKKRLLLDCLELDPDHGGARNALAEMNQPASSTNTLQPETGKATL